MKKRILFPVCLTLCFSFFSLQACGKNSASGIPKEASVMEDIEKAYIFGFPAVLMHINERVMTNPVAGSGNVPPNRFKNTGVINAKNNAHAFADADFFCSEAWLELGSEPLVFEIPDIKDRYDFFTIMDAWTNIITSLGKRTSGTAFQQYLITGPGWTGTVPEGMMQIKSPTNMAFISGRIQTDSREDGMKNVLPVQKKLKLIPLSRYEENNYEPFDKDADKIIDMSSPVEQIFKMDIISYFNLLNALMTDNPPYESDKAFLGSIKYLKISPGEEFDLELFDEEERQAVSMIPETVKKRFEDAYAVKEFFNGWEILPFAANAHQGEDYEKRALKVYGGIRIDLPEDAVIMKRAADDEGIKFDGKNKYVLRFEKDLLPPVDAFWSLTLYDGKNLFNDNALNRYSVSERKTLKRAKDGSLEIYIQNDNPGKSKESNWLPAPKEGLFSLVFGAYWPQKTIIKKQWSVPAVKKQAGSNKK